MALSYERKTLFRIWKRWQDVRYQDYLKVTLSTEAKQKLKAIHIKRTLQKWSLRTRKTLFFRVR